MEEDRRKALEELIRLGELQQEAESKYDEECDKFWEGLDYDSQLKAFYSVCKRIHRGDIKEHGSYRYVLYDVFGFAPDAYVVGMNCGYMDIHNAIFDGIELVDDGK